MSAPAWFTDALATSFDRHQVDVDAVPIRFRTAGPLGAPMLVFVHGGTAHAHWWLPIAARFATAHRVVLPDLSGHGDSGHRPGYAFEQWAAEVGAVIRAAAPNDADPPVLVGHSIGGLVCMALAAKAPELVGGLVACDTLLADPSGAAPAVAGRSGGTGSRPSPSYASVAEARARFRTIPPQDDYAGFVLDHVVPRSLRRQDGRWVWKFDRSILSQFSESVAGLAWPWLARSRCPVAYLRSEHGLVPRLLVASLERQLAGRVVMREIPGAGHHAMLDRPDELHDVLQEVLPELRRGHITPA